MNGLPEAVVLVVVMGCVIAWAITALDCYWPRPTCRYCGAVITEDRLYRLCDACWVAWTFRHWRIPKAMQG